MRELRGKGQHSALGAYTPSEANIRVLQYAMQRVHENECLCKRSVIVCAD